MNPLSYQSEKERIEAIKDLWSSQVSIRNPGDKTRWNAMSFVGHRTKLDSVDMECPVPERDLYDASGIMAVRTLVESLGGSVMSPNQDWFSMRIVSKDYRTDLSPSFGVQYTDYAKRAMSDEMNHSNFYDAQTLAFYDSISCGYSCTLFQNDENTNRIFLQTFEPWNCWFDVDMSGNYNTFFYRYRLDGYQLLERFGEENLSKKVLDEAKKGRKNARFEILFCIVERPYPRDRNGKRIRFSTKINKNMKYAALHILLSDNAILQESGYRDFPVVIHVWEKDGDNPYGKGLVMRYISEFGKLNRLAYEYGLSVTKMNHGAWLVPDTMINSFDDNPEARIPYSSQDLLPRPLQESIDVNAAGEQLALQQQYISKLFYNDIFSYLLNQDKVFTATQVNAVKAEGMSKIYPIYTRLQSQKIDPSLSLVYKLMVQNGRLNPPPRDIINKENKNKLSFVLDSAMSQMLQRYQSQTSNSVLFDLYVQLLNMNKGNLADKYIDLGNLILAWMEQTGAASNLYVSESRRKEMEAQERQIAQQQLELSSELTRSEINRNNAGAANLNNAVGANGGYQ